MRRLAAALLLSLCLATTAAAVSAVPKVYAGTMSGDDKSTSTAQTIVTAEVEEDIPQPDEPEEQPPEDGDTTKPDGTSDQTPCPVKTGDPNTIAALAFLLLLSGIVIMAEKIRRA